MSTTYQTHTPTSKGVSDSPRKLERLRLPENLSGKSVLDIGCNEGFFCGVAASRGAARVIGLDSAQPALDFARAQYPHPSIEWLNQRWDTLPQGKFDLILWTSGMHYEPDPAHVLDMIADRLAPGGLFVLECGVSHVSTMEMVLVQRQGDSRWIPTEEFLAKQLLRRFTHRRVAAPEPQQGDPIRRAVYHCRKRQPLVLLARGAAHHDKLTFARQFAPAATKMINIDAFVYRILIAEHAHGALGPFVKANFKDYDLSSLYDGIDRAGLTAEYAACLADGIAASDEAVIIEGYMTDPQAAALATRLRDSAIVWDARRLEPSASPPPPLRAPAAQSGQPAPTPAPAAEAPKAGAGEGGRLATLFDMSRPGYYTCIAGYSHAKYSQYTEASRHIHTQILRILESFGVESYLFAGSMVGYVRNRQMPKWMDDLDVIIFNHQVELFESRVVPYLERCGFMCWLPDGFLRGGYQLISLVQGNDRAHVEGYDRARTIRLADGVSVPVPWAQVDVFYTMVSEDGFIRNISGWGLYNEKNIPVDWVRPGVFVEIEGRRQRVFSRWEDDIKQEYGDVMNNVIVSTHGTTFLTARDTPWETVSAEFDRIVAQTSRNLPPSLSEEAHAAFRPLHGHRAAPAPDDSFDAIVAAIVHNSAEEVQLSGGDQIFWVMDLKRLFPKLRIRVRIADAIEAGRAAHLRAFIDTVDAASEQVAAKYGDMIDHLRRILG